MKIVELFAGYGSQILALKKLGYEVESKISEIDKYAIQAYNQLHGSTFNYGDICKIKALGDADLWTYSFPCQDLSVAGKQAGIKEGTRSGLLLEVERLLEIAVTNKNNPKYLLLENVKALVSKKFKPDFDKWLNKLDKLGYNNYWQVLNAKDYGVPQNRERVFVVSIRKDIDTKGYEFPEPIKLEKRLKDVLDDTVDEKYYLSNDKTEKLVESLKNKNICNTIRCGSRGSLDKSHCWDVVLVGGEQKNQAVKTDGVSTCLTSSMGTGGVKEIYENSYRIRKLTPHECFRLMGVPDEYFNRLHDISNSQLYKLAGNSIVVDVLEAIFKNLLPKEKNKQEIQLNLF